MTEPHSGALDLRGARGRARAAAAACAARAAPPARRPKRRGRRLGVPRRRAGAAWAVAAFAAYTVLAAGRRRLHRERRLRRTRDGCGDRRRQRRRHRRGHRDDAAQGRRRQDARGAYLEAAAADPNSSRASSRAPTRSRSRWRQPTRWPSSSTPPTARSVPRVTVREGLWKSEVFAALSKGTGVPVAEYVAAAKDAESLGLPAVGQGQRRGLPLPVDLRVPRQGHHGRQQLKIMVAKTVERAREGRGRAEADMERVMVVASIVEGEVSGDADRGKVARVIENRLRTDGPPSYGLLQMDSTVHFARAEARPGRHDRRRPRQPEPLQHLQAPGPAARARSTAPARPRSRPRPSPTDGRLVLLRHGQPRHRRDQVRDDARTSTTATSRSSRSGAAANAEQVLSGRGPRLARWRTPSRRSCTRAATARPGSPTGRTTAHERGRGRARRVRRRRWTTPGAG